MPDELIFFTCVVEGNPARRALHRQRRQQEALRDSTDAVVIRRRDLDC